MTREEAAAIIRKYDANGCGYCHQGGNEIEEAFDMAIKALEQKPIKGYWKRISMDKYSEHAKYWYRCDRCGKDNLGNTDYCPNCGAMMQEVEVKKHEKP